MLAKAPHLTVRDNQANIINTAEIEVFEAGTTNAVTVFSDSAGQSELSQPFPVTSKGVIQFYADGGLYDVKITNDGDVTIIRDVQIGSSQSKDASGSGSDVITAVYQEQANAPSSSSVIWVQGYTEPRECFFAWDGVSSYQYDELDEEVVARTPYDHTGFAFSNPLSSLTVTIGSKLFMVANPDPFGPAVLVSMDLDFGNIQQVDGDILDFKETPRGVVYVSGSELKKIEQNLDISVLCTGLPATGATYLHSSGNYLANADGKIVKAFDLTGSSAVEDESYDASSESSAGAVTDPIYDGSTLYFKAQSGTFDYSYYSIDVAGGGGSTTLISADADGFADAVEKNGIVAFPLGDSIRFTDGSNSFSFGTSATLLADIISFDGSNVVFAVRDEDKIYEYDVATGAEVRNVDFMFNTFINKSGDKNYGISDDGYSVNIFDPDSFTIKTVTDQNYKLGAQTKISFVQTNNPKRICKIYLNGEWIAFSNNNAENGIPDPVMLGQDLNKLNQDHPDTGLKTIYLQSNESPYGFTGASSVVIGDDAYGEPGQPWDNSVVIGSDAGVGGDDNSMSGNGIAIGNGSYAYNLYSTAVGDGAYAEHYDTSGISSGAGPLAIGNNSYVDGIESVAIGGNSYVSTSNGGATAVGFGANGYGDYGVSVGHNSQNYGSGGVAVGQDSYNNNTDGVALGRGANNNHDRSVSLGSDTNSSEIDTVAIGDRNVDIQGNGRGLIMRSPDGTIYDVTVDNAGALSIVARA